MILPLGRSLAGLAFLPSFPSRNLLNLTGTGSLAVTAGLVQQMSSAAGSDPGARGALNVLGTSLKYDVGQRGITRNTRVASEVIIGRMRQGFRLLPSQTAVCAYPTHSDDLLGCTLQEVCSLPSGPATGWRRDGYCNTDDFDHGSHCVCSEVTEQFLEYTKAQGNDLSTPRGQFTGLSPGDRWCLCSSRWLQAQKAGKAPLVILESTHEKALTVIPLEILMEHRSSLEAGVEAPTASEL